MKIIFVIEKHKMPTNLNCGNFLERKRRADRVSQKTKYRKFGYNQNYRFYWVVFQHAVAHWIANCNQSKAAKGSTWRPHGQMRQYNSNAPSKRIAIDVVVPFPISNCRYQSVLVEIHLFSKYTLFWTKRQLPKLKCFVDNWVCRFCVPP